ncbi:IMPACT family protein [Microscilla marina]|uniref:Thymidylate synthase n=1 Tax=Microscilla marina ATCC 23134 TaxID=313606 RepID=A1ZT98_MICM2|nr:YigZ family protein [Microscilla marina]EAY26320.1 thymidylate synthase [Microscilla marina ATCC 23134]
MKDTYQMITAPSEGFFKDRGSKFFAFAYPVHTEEEIKSCQDELRKKYYDARHHCYAFVLGAHQQAFRASDDGEPKHSAGDPILGQIRSFDLTNVLVVVVRYFGGTKLGVSGLINAYKTAAAEALEAAKVEEKLMTQNISIQFEYDQMNLVMKMIKDYALEIVTQEQAMNCTMTLAIRNKLFEEVATTFGKMHPLKVLEGGVE